MPRSVLVAARRSVDYQGTTYGSGEVFWATPRDVLVLAHAKQISLTRPSRAAVAQQAAAKLAAKPAPKPATKSAAKPELKPEPPRTYRRRDLVPED